MASINSFQGTLGQRRAAHLLRRASYRYTKARVDQLAVQSADQAVNSLLALHPFSLDQPVYDKVETPSVIEIKTWTNPPGVIQVAGYPAPDFELLLRLICWWTHEAGLDPGIGHKMTFFWHQYLAVSANSAYPNTTLFDYLALLRWGALGNYKKLVNKMVADNTMLRYLNNNQNTASNPNENFAREFLELFTIGKGPQIGPGDYTNYTEDDIVQAARVFTGYQTNTNRTTLDPETGIPRGTTSIGRHDKLSKKFSDKFGGVTIAGATNAAGIFTEVSQFVDLVLAQPETARNICRRLYTFFVHKTITEEIETDIIAPLADIFRNNNFEILPVLKKLLKSQHFYDLDDSSNTDEIVGGLIKSPLELTLQALSFFNIPIPDPLTQNATHFNTFYQQGVITRMFGYANLPLFYPIDVAGYAAYHQEPDYSRQWFNSSTVIARYKLPAMLLSGKRLIGGSPNSSIGIKLNIVPWVRNSGICSDPSDPYVLVRELLSYMLPEMPDNDRFDYFYLQIFLDNLPPSDWTYEWEKYIATNNETEVKIPLEKLINYIMFSPEYQTF